MKAAKTSTTVSPDFDVLLDPGAIMPTRAHDTDVGYDIHALSVSYTYEKQGWFKRLLGIEPRITTVKCETGVHIAPKDNSFWVMGLPNSRVSKLPFVLGNSCGVIDPDYRGSIKFIYNVLPYAGKCTNEEVKKFFEPFFDGDEKHLRVIGQIVPMKRFSMNLNAVDALTKTERGEGGFGSTEKAKGAQK